MSILQSAVDRLFTQENTVIYQPERDDRNPMKVQALALFVINDEPVELVFCKGYDGPLMLTSETCYDHTSRNNDLRSCVVDSELARKHLRHGLYGDYETPGELFTALLRAGTHPDVKLLEFLPVEPVYPHFYGDSQLREAFDGVTHFTEHGGVKHEARMLLGLNWRSPEQRHNRETPPLLKFGNAIVWSATDQNLHWVTRTPNGVVSLGVVQSAEGYSEVLRFVNQFKPGGWGVSTVHFMPYHIPKYSPRDEQKPKVEEPPCDAHEVTRMLSGLMDIAPGQLPPAHAVMLDAICKRHFPTTTTIRNQYVKLLDEAINEYMIILDGVGPKKRAEIKEGIIQHFIAKTIIA